MFAGIPRSLLLTGEIILLILLVFTGIYYFAENQKHSIGLEENTYTDHTGFSAEQQIVSVKRYEDLQSTLIGTDGSRMVLTGTAGIATESQPFYMDEKKVTNFMFVEFLNSLRDQLSVKNGVVRRGETIISYIASGSSEDEAIIYEHNRFHLGDQSVGNRPVVRVTFHGAHLYAAGYGKDLLSDEEWRSAHRFHATTFKSDSADGNRTEKENVVTMMHDTPRVPLKGPDIMVLDDMGQELKEWVSISDNPAEE